MKRILVIGDKSHLYDELCAILARKGNACEMVFAASGKAAIEKIESEPFEVVVADMDMPGIGRYAVLKRAQEIQPHTARIVLAAQELSEAAMDIVMVAHQFLRKPCDPRYLEYVIERTSDIQKLLSESNLSSIIGGTNELPSAPGTYTELTKALSNSNVSITDIAGIIEKDMAMSAKILKIVNSAFFGLTRNITSIERAVLYLGIQRIKSLVLTFSIFEIFNDDPKIPGFSMSGLQKHAFATGIVAMNLATDKRQKEDAFTAALLHDIGKLILSTRAPQKLTTIIEQSVADQQPMFVIEKETLGSTHAEIGAFLLGLWNLPYQIVEAVACHHIADQISKTEFDLVAIIHLSDLLVHEQISTSPDGCDQSLLIIDPQYLHEIGMIDKLEAWRDLAADQIKTPNKRQP